MFTKLTLRLCELLSIHYVCAKTRIVRISIISLLSFPDILIIDIRKYAYIVILIIYFYTYVEDLFCYRIQLDIVCIANNIDNLLKTYVEQVKYADVLQKYKINLFCRNFRDNNLVFYICLTTSLQYHKHYRQMHTIFKFLSSSAVIRILSAT